MKRTFSVMFTAVFCMCLVTGCDGCTSQEQRDRLVVDKRPKQYATAQPIPMFDWSQERDMAIQLYKLRNQPMRTWTVWRSRGTGMIEGHCDSVGYPLPYDVQLTNPLQRDSGSNSAVIEQPEPNGLFGSKHTTATWVRQVVEINGKVVEVPVYIEGVVTCYPYPIIVDYEKNRVTRADAGAPTITLEKSKNK